jgi:ABC-2 type transport system ATP-binding protein
MRLGRLMHVEDMHARRSLRMLLLRFNDGLSAEFPGELGLTVRERNGETWLLEHRGEMTPLLAWLCTQDVAEIAIGTEDLRSLYDRYHGAGAEADASGVPA